MSRYWSVIAILQFNLIWVCLSATSSVDLTLIGHLRGWVKISYPKWFGWFINRNRRGYKILQDCTTHPQVLVMFGIDTLVLIGSILLTIFVWLNVNDIETWVLWMIASLLYAPAITMCIFIKTKANREYDTKAK